MRNGRQGMRMRAVLMAMAGWSLAVQPAAADDTRTIQAAVDDVIAKVAADLGRMGFPKVRNVAVVPLRSDPQDYATSSLKSAVTKTSFGLFTRSDEEWDKLLAEIEWGVRREDVMDPETVKKFGRVQGVDAILFGRVWDSGVNMWSTRGHAKISVYLAEVETGQVLWSSGPVEGEAFLHWSDALTQFWRFPLLAIGAFVLLLILLALLRGVVRAIRHAARPL